MNRFGDIAGRGEGSSPRRRFYNGPREGVPAGGRVPPHSIEAEMAVLGAMMLGDRTGVERALEMLTKDDFYRDAHSHIFDAMANLNAKSEPIDLITLKDELQSRGILQQVGDVAYLMQLGEIEFTTANLNFYARIVQEKGALRRLIDACSQIAGDAYSEPEEVSDLMEQAERLILDVARQKDAKGFAALRPLLNQIFDKVDHLYNEKGAGVTGIDTGFVDLNMMTSGLQGGDLFILAARPAMGKTSLAMGIGQNAALIGKTVAVFSLEMSKEQLVQRMICSEARVDAHRVRTGFLREDDWSRLAEAVQRLWDCNLFIDDSTDMTALEMRAKCRRLHAEHGLDLVVVDYLQLMRGGGRSESNRNEEITTIARGLKSLAREMNVPVIALSQLSRAVERREDKRPMLSDLRESGSIEAEADLVTFIYRPAYYERKETVSADNNDGDDNQNQGGGNDEFGGGEEAEVIIAKHRNGPVGTVKLAFLPKYARFDNLAEFREDNPF
ncbi:MAG: replicative DNA helicase [bacterium]